MMLAQTQLGSAVRSFEGRIVAVRLNGAVTAPSVINAEGALASEITYDITAIAPDGTFIHAEDRTPDGQRPSITHRIICAKLDDDCRVVQRGPEVKFYVAEGVFVGNCESKS